MIREEFEWSDTSQTLLQSVTTVLVGPAIDDRSAYFARIWRETDCNLVEIRALGRGTQLQVTVSKRGIVTGRYDNIPTAPGLRTILTTLSLEFVCFDLTSLQHAVIMYATYLLLSELKPKKLFATYAQPLAYAEWAPSGEVRLSEERLGLGAVPGFARRSRHLKLLAFLGFEGDRLSKILEDNTDIVGVVPVIGFPAVHPGWQARTLYYCSRSIVAAQALADVHKCKADSVFSALEFINKQADILSASGDTRLGLAPLGTRPHSLACAIYATRNSQTHLIYDHPVEKTNRSQGIASCRTYHLSSFLQS